MKSKILFVLLILAMAISVYFTYERSFAWKNFDVVNSDEESVDDTENDSSAADAATNDTVESTTTDDVGSTTSAMPEVIDD